MSDSTVLEQFVTSSTDQWEKRQTENGVEYVRNGFPEPEESYHAAKGSAVEDFQDPYEVVDEFSAEDIDSFADRPDELDDKELQALKDVRAAYTVQHAYEEVPFYRELFDEHGVNPYDVEGTDDLWDLPVFDGDDILQNQPPTTRDWKLKNKGADTRRPFNTSGSTGNPKTVFYSYDEADRMYTDVKRGMLHVGAEEGDKVVNYFPFVGLNVSCMGNEGGMEKLNMETVPISNTPFPTEVEGGIVQSHRPQDLDQGYHMLGLPSHVDSKGRAFQQQGFDPKKFGIDTIVLAGEPVSESRKQSIAETYDADVVEFLGSTEGGGFAYECLDRSERLHVIDDSVHVEVMDKDTQRPVGEGEEGEMVISRLLHPGEESASPIIQYNQGDFVTYFEHDGACDCRLNKGKLIKPPRRDSWSFVLGAVNLDPVYFEDSIYDHDEMAEVVDGYQLRIDYDEDTGRDVLDVVLETNDAEYSGETLEDISVTENPDSALDELANKFFEGNSHLQDTVDTVDAARIDIKVVDEIEMEPGKPQRLIDRRQE